jgi:hypothetical protein
LENYFKNKMLGKSYITIGKYVGRF